LGGTLSLALRNLLRNRRRSLMTLVAMMLGLVAVLLFGGYIRDINYAIQSDFVQRTGHLQIHRQGYFKLGSGNPAGYGISEYERVLDVIRKDAVLAPMLAVATPMLQFGGIAGNFASGVSRTVLVSGTVVDDQNRMREWNAYGLRRLRQPLSLSGSSLDTVIIGTGVARALQLCGRLQVPDCDDVQATAQPENGEASLPGDIAELSLGMAAEDRAKRPAQAMPRIEILASNHRGAPNVAAVQVLRAEFQGIKELDDMHVGLHLGQAQRLMFGSGQPKVTALALQLKETAHLPTAQTRLSELLKQDLGDEPLEVVDYETLSPFYGQTLGMFAAIFGFVSVLIGAIVLFTVSNTMTMAVVERTTEIGTLRAIGLRRSGIRRLFLVEGLMLGLLATLFGTALALALAAMINALGLTWIPPGRVEEVPLAVSLYGEYPLMLASAIGLLLVAGLSAILPAARAARMDIVEALRHV
jgi:putative ABC transport system permease protein